MPQPSPNFFLEHITVFDGRLLGLTILVEDKAVEKAMIQFRDEKGGFGVAWASSDESGVFAHVVIVKINTWRLHVLYVHLVTGWRQSWHC
jgi:hypothetical protein